MNIHSLVTIARHKQTNKKKNTEKGSPENSIFKILAIILLIIFGLRVYTYFTTTHLSVWEAH